MKNFTVVVCYEGGISLDVEANNIDEAKKKAEKEFMDMDYNEFINEINDTIDWKICDAWEEK